MSRREEKALAALIEEMMREASWLLSHAEALTDYRRGEEADVEWGRAAVCEDRVACLLEAASRDTEAAVHRLSAAACHERVHEYPQAVTQIRAALAGIPSGAPRTAAEQQLARCLEHARKQISQTVEIRK